MTEGGTSGVPQQPPEHVPWLTAAILPWARRARASPHQSGRLRGPYGSSYSYVFPA